MVLNNDYGHGGDVYHNRVRLDFSGRRERAFLPELRHELS